MTPHKLLQSFVGLLTLCAIGLYSCSKGGTTTPIKKSTIDSTTLYLTAGTWRLTKVEYPQTATTWAVASTSGTLGYDTMIFGTDKTFFSADNNTVITTGTWELSTTAPLLTRTFNGSMEVDTVDILNASTLRFVIPKQTSVGLQFYEYYRDTYTFKK